MIKAIFFDLDNTIYDVNSIATELLTPLFDLIEASGEFEVPFEEVKNLILHKPLQTVAEKCGFSKRLLEQCITHLKDREYCGNIIPFDGFMETKTLPVEKFLVTSGFTKMQLSKVRGMKLTDFFNEVHIVDFFEKERTKKDIFIEIMNKHHYLPSEILVLGDDLHSEIKAAKKLGMNYLLFDKNRRYDDYQDDRKITDYGEVMEFFSKEKAD